MLNAKCLLETAFISSVDLMRCCREAKGGKILVIVMAMFASACAGGGYKQKIMQPWLGASSSELFSRWGYPMNANDLIKIDYSTTVYSYRSYNFGPHGNTPCVVSFTVKDDVVFAYSYQGANCPKITRY